VWDSSVWKRGAVELPGLPTAFQLFVLGVVMSMWHARAAAAAAGG
jgi:hypothetical protein